MKKGTMSIFLIMVLISALIFPSLAVPAELSVKHEVYDGVTLNLSADWVELSSDEVARRGRNVYPDSSEDEIKITSMFALEDPKDPTKPFLMVTYLNIGRFPEDELEALAGGNAKKAQKGGKGLIDPARSRYLPDKDLIYTKTGMKIENFGTLQTIAAMKLLKEDAILFTFYYPEADEARYESLVDAIINQIEIDEAITYDKGASGSKMSGSLLVIVMCLFSYFLFKRMHPSKRR